MSLNKFNPRTGIILLFIFFMAAVRIFFSLPLQHSPIGNFSPIGAMALFSGSYFISKSKAYLFPLLTLWISDLFLNRFVYYHEWRLLFESFYWTYGAFALMVLTGMLIIKKVTVKNVLVASLIVVLIHWIVTDFGVWIEGTMYPKNAAGWVACLVAAIPYESNVLAGTLLYSAVFFGLFEWIQKKYPIVALRAPTTGLH